MTRPGRLSAVGFVFLAINGIVVPTDSGTVQPDHVQSIQRGFTGGPVDFQFTAFCDIVTLNFLSNGVASTIAGTSRVPPSCNALAGTVAGSLVPVGNDFKMGLTWFFSRGGELTMSCNINNNGAGPCLDSRGRAFDVSVRAPGDPTTAVLPGAAARPW